MRFKTLLLVLAGLLLAMAIVGAFSGDRTAFYSLLAALALYLAATWRREATPRPPRESPALPPEFQAELRELTAAGQKIAAIKRYRDVTGVGLKEAKDYVDALAAGAEPAVGAERHGLPLPPELEEDVRTIAAFGSKLEAIKRVRELSGVGLKEAKDYVDSLGKQG